MLHRLTCAILLAVLLASAAPSASASHLARSHSTGWHSFRSKKLGIAFRYPAGWQVAVNGVEDQVMASAPSPSRDALTAQIVPIRASSSLRATVSRFVAYQRQTGDTNFARVAWSAAALGKSRAMATVVVPPTEGGSPVSQAIYLAQSRSRVYEVTLFSVHSPAYSRLSQFQPVYGKILSTWRFI